LYVAHTANDALDVINCVNDRYLHSIPNLTGVAGALVSEERDLIFTSNRGENTIGMFTPDHEADLVKVPVGVKPNGLSFDPHTGLLLAANVGDPEVPGSFTVSMVDVEKRAMIASIPVPGRTRWTIFDAASDAFYVNIADPAQIVVIDAKQPTSVARTFTVLAKHPLGQAAGPHGLDLDPERRRLFCACDAKKLIALDISSGAALKEADLSGVPDVIFFNAALRHLYVAIGDPGVIDVFDTDTLRRIEVVSTEKGAHTIGFDADRHKVYAFLPQSHCAKVYKDEE
jgi:DNA-binding beta-propeller fold protein YncE